MTVQEMHTSFRLGLDKTNSANVASFEPDEIDAWLNYSVERFIKQRLFGNNTRKEAFPNSQKRYEDLYTLIVQNPNLGFHLPLTSPITPANVATATSPLPLDFYHLIYSYVTYKKTKDPYRGNSFTRDIDLIDDSIYQNLTRVWGGLGGNGPNNIAINKKCYGRLIGYNQHSPTLTTPSNSPFAIGPNVSPTPRYIQVFVPSFSNIQAVGINYIKNWVKLTISTPTQVLELPEHTHQEIVDLCVNIVLENIADPRYQTNTNELNQQE